MPAAPVGLVDKCGEIQARVIRLSHTISLLDWTEAKLAILQLMRNASAVYETLTRLEIEGARK